MQLCAHNLEGLVEMPDYLVKYHIPKPIQKEIKNLNEPITVKRWNY